MLQNGVYVMSEYPDTYASIALIECKQKIAKTYKKSMGHVLIQVVYNCFQLGISFPR